jgi:hypothetical protein
MSLVPLDLTPEERRIGLANLEEHYFGEATKLTGDRIREDWPPEVFAHFGEITASDFLRQKGASEDAIRYVLLGWEDNAAADYIKDVLNHNAEPLMKVATISFHAQLLPNSATLSTTVVLSSISKAATSALTSPTDAPGC